MATFSEQAPLPPSGGPPRCTTETAGRLVEYEEFIESQLRRTRGHVWSVDFAGALMTLVAGTLAYFFLAAVADHWIVPGGLGFWGRLLFLSGYVTAAVVYLFRQVLPLLLRRINPLYAAYTIERSRPTLKNALVNFLMFRANPSGLSAVVYEGIEAQAATHLARAPLDAAVDRSKLVRIGYALVAILLASAIYAMLSPKDLFQTVGRVAMPWAQIDPPTRTTITEIEPGDVQAFRGQQVTVKARVEGLGDDAQVRLLYTTDDGQSVDRAVEMTLPRNGDKHVGTLPGGDAELQQSLKYRIVAGDAVSGPHRVEVVAAPTIIVRSVEYKYPAYTALVAERLEHQGDIKAIEGTEITLHAVANQPIASAYVDFDCDQKLDYRMRIDGDPAGNDRAYATFTASLARDRRSYQLIFKNEAGQQNPQPVRHQIEVTRDLAPEIKFVGPKPDELDLPANGAVDLEVVANDPDFALRTVRLSATSGGKPVVESILLDEAWRGQFVRKFRFEPRKLGLKPGDTVAYRAIAEDTKQPAPNRTETAERRIRIVSPSERTRDKDRLAKRDKRGGDDPQGAADGPGGGDDENPRAGDAARDETPVAESQDAQPRDEAQGDADDPQSPEPGQDGRPANDPRQDAGEENREGQGQKDAAGGGPSDDPSAQREQDGASRRDESGGRDGAKGQKEVGHRAEPGGGDARETAANDGSNDRDAIERILEHRDDQNKTTPRAGQQQPGQQKQEQAPSSQQRPAADEKQQPGDGQESAPKQGQDREAANKKPSQGREESRGKQGQKSASPRDDQSADGKPDGSDPKAAPQDNKGKGQSGDAKPGNQDPQRDAAQRGQGSEKGKGLPADKPESADDPQPGDEGPGQNEKDKRPSDRAQPDASRDAAEPEPGDKPADRRAGSKGERGDASQDKSGQGTPSEDDGTAERKPPSSRQGNKSDAKESTGEKEIGNSGAGKSDPNKQGSPSPQGQQQPRDKSPHDGAEETPNKPGDTPQSPSTSQRESNSEGQDDGDRSGGGKKGGGQKASKPGTGGAGQNTAADDGAGRSEEKGNGETSDRAGEDREAAGQTGQSGSTPGQGSRSAPASDDKAEPMGSSGDGAPPSEPGQPGQGSQGKSGPSAANPTGGGQPRQGPTTEQKWRPTDDKADAANLEYARKATDLALTHLKDELKKERPDPRLLERLGWTRGDLEQFVKRWEQMRDQAQSPGEKGASARRELDDALRSLGLRPRATSLESNSARDDKSQGYKESRRTSPPPEYAEQYKAYTQGTAKGGK